MEPGHFRTVGLAPVAFLVVERALGIFRAVAGPTPATIYRAVAREEAAVELTWRVPTHLAESVAADSVQVVSVVGWAAVLVPAVWAPRERVPVAWELEASPEEFPARA